MLEIAGRIATHSPLAIWGTKEMINYTRDHSVADGLRYMAGWQTGMFQAGDMMEEFAAKAEKRDPKFEDLPGPPRRHLTVAAQGAMTSGGGTGRTGSPGSGQLAGAGPEAELHQDQVQEEVPEPIALGVAGLGGAPTPSAPMVGGEQHGQCRP